MASVRLTSDRARPLLRVGILEGSRYQRESAELSDLLSSHHHHQPYGVSRGSGPLIIDAALPSAGHGVACGCIRVMPYSRYMQWPLR